MTKQKPKFRRSDGHKYSKLGVRRKKKQVYRKAKGRDNKIRLNRAGRLRKVKLGFRGEKKSRDLVKGMKLIRIFNLEDIKTIKEDEMGVIAKIGNRKKKQIAKYAQENKIRLLNLNPGKFLEKIESELKKKKESKSERTKKKTERDKKAKEKEEKEKKEVEEDKGKKDKSGTDSKNLEVNNKENRKLENKENGK